MSGYIVNIHVFYTGYTEVNAFNKVTIKCLQ